eukprot:4742023-Pleurochrysis_carterae.AAC.1
MSPLAARVMKVADGTASVRSTSWLTPASAARGCDTFTCASVSGVTEAVRLPSPRPRTSWCSRAPREGGWPAGQR